ncbi:Katanin p60 ATPase-containing subunit A-like 2 [Eumeta japonica]|uniref:Katanin p60 ATPase-containing subunit A-like 2 n=1 Tax=Eumeta variegata TaxID=151549 RepID=A0A4C1X8D6_EUMVA|nr:Katanin p60 ATPase-containing subunit A-like 2 [Eumeta japonica]
MLRRLEKRIHIPLPDFETRVRLFESFLNTKSIEIYPKVDYEELATKTEGYSGSDIKLVCKEALMSTVRKMLPHLNKGDNTKFKDRLDVSDILNAISKTKPISKNLTEKHEKWQNEMGCR